MSTQYKFFVGVDPGVVCTGLGVVCPTERSVSGCVIQRDDWLYETPKLIVDKLQSLVGNRKLNNVIACVETMRVNDKKYERDILDLQAQGGAISYALSAAGAKVLRMPVAEWKGQVPKEIDHARVVKEIQKIYGPKEPIIFSVKESLMHNALDAISMAWKLKDKTWN